MKILAFSKKDGFAKIKANTLDDLWHLSKIVDVGDLVTGAVERKIRLGGEEDKARSARKKYTVKIKVTKTSLEAGLLRVTGTIVEAPEELGRGVSQTVSVSPGDIIKIEKEWKNYQSARLFEAEKESSTANALVLVLDDGEANFAILTPSGIKQVSDFTLGLAKKRVTEKRKDSELEKVVDEFLRLDNELKPEYVIVASPIFWKDELMKTVSSRDKKITKKIKLEDVSTGSARGFTELMSRGAFDRVINAGRMQKEFMLVEQLLKEIMTGGLSAYGYDAVKSAAEAGAVKTLLVADSLIQSAREKGTYDELEYVINLVDKIKGEVHIISTEHEAGQKLKGLTGIAGFLRYKI